MVDEPCVVYYWQTQVLPQQSCLHQHLVSESGPGSPQNAELCVTTAGSGPVQAASQVLSAAAQATELPCL